MVAWSENGQGYWIFEEEKKVKSFIDGSLVVPAGTLVKSVGLIRMGKGKDAVITDRMHDEIFIPTYTRFLAAQGREVATEKYAASQIIKVWWDFEDKTVNVKFKNGDWFHFTRNGEWY